MHYLIACIVVAPLLLQTAPDPDFWWHLKTGQDLLLLGSLPHHDPYSFGPTHEWINHSWAHDLIVAYVYETWGELGLITLRGLIMLICGLSFSATLHRRIRQPFVLTCLLIFGFYYISLGLDLRPQIWTHLFLLLCVLLADLRRAGANWTIFLLPPILALWSNLHGGFLFGLAYVGLSSLTWALTHSLSLSHLARTTLFITICWAATCLNPYGLELYNYVLNESTFSHQYNADWRPVWNDYALPFVFFFCAPLVLSLTTRIFPRTETALFFLLFAYVCSAHGRFLPLFSIFSILSCADPLAYLCERYKSSLVVSITERRDLLAVLLSLFLFIPILSFPERYHFRDVQFFAKATNLPRTAVEVLRSDSFGPNVATILDWGGFLILELYPRYLVSIDGRNITTYDSEYIETSLKAIHFGDTQQFLSTVPSADLVLVPAGSKICAGLSERDDWRLIHQNQISCLYAKSAQD